MKLLTAFCLAFCLALTYAANSDSDTVEIAAAEEPAPDYLPPAEEPKEVSATNIDKDGYRYKTIRRLKYRQRREVSQEYLPPTAVLSQEYLPPPNNNNNDIETPVGADGYRYKTVRRLRFRTRHRRDVSEIAAPPSNDYLPPANANEDAPAEQNSEIPNAELTKDGYRYKTVRRLRYRYRY